MPLYEYQCADCGKVLEMIQKFSDPPLTECPSCGGSLEKLLSAPAIQFKGSGWYITDYARKSGNGEGAKKTSSEPAGDAKGGTSEKKAAASESKSAETKSG